MDLKTWLESNGLGKYVDLFAENDIDLDILPELTKSDLDELRLPIGARRRLALAIENLNGAGSTRQPGSAPSAVTGERRHATVLFSDLSGYTSMTEQLDPEEVRDLMGRIKTEAVRIVEAHGGSVNQFVGDEILALFGIPSAHKDDAHRAVRAAFEMHQMVREFSPDTESRLGRAMRLHSGIATGLIVTHSTDERNGRIGITGDTVNIGARLKSLAGDNAILICSETRRSVKDAYELQALPEALLKGKQNRVTPYKVIKASSNPREPAIPFVGRRPELSQIVIATGTCLTTSHGRMLVIRGEPGIGKSRLAREAERIARENGFECHKVEIPEIGGGTPTDPLRRLIRSLVSANSLNQQHDLHEAARNLLSQGGLEADDEPFLLDLMGVQLPVELRAKYDAMENAYRSSRKQRTVTMLFRSVAKKRRQFLLIEDIHWADSEMLTLIAALGAATSECPALLLATTRTHGDPVDADWHRNAGSCVLHFIDLPPLTDADSRALAASFGEVASRTLQRCVQRAAGNPLFLEQLLLNPAQVEGATIPGSVQGLVLARVDELPADNKTVLQAASVIGQRFEPEAVQHIIDTPRLELGVLLRQGLIREDDTGYMFAHALVRDGVYESLLYTTRHEYHSRAALWYEDRDKTLCAEHLEAAGDPAAALAFLAASQSEAQALRLDRALRSLERGEKLGRGTENHCLLLLEKGRLQRELGALQDSIGSYEKAVTAARNDEERCLGLIGMAEGMRLSDDFDRCLSVLAQAQPIGDRLERADLQAQINFLRGCVFFGTGRTESCLDAYQSAKIAAEKSDSREIELRALSGLADGLYAVGRIREGYEVLSNCVARAHQQGFYRIEAANRVAKGWSQQYIDGIPAALAELQLGLAQSQEVGVWRSVWLAKNMISGMLILMSRLDEAESLLSELKAELADMEAPRLISVAYTYFAYLSFYRGNIEAAHRHAKRAQEIYESTGGAHFAAANLALVSVSAPNYECASHALGDGLEILRSGAAVHNHFEYWRHAIDTALRFEKWDEAIHFSDQLDQFNQKDHTDWAAFFVRRGHALAKLGRGQESEDLYQEVLDAIELGKRMGILIALPELYDAAKKLKRVQTS